MTSRTWSALLAVVLSTAVVLAAPAAHAERIITDDAAGDVVSITFGESDDLDNSEVVPAPDATSVDMTRTIVDHRASRVRVTVRFRDVRPSQFRITEIQLRTPQRQFAVSISRMRGEGSTVDMTRAGRELECDGLRAALDRATDRLTTTIPTSCLDGPRWVQVGVGSAALEGDVTPGDAEAGPVLADDSHLDGRIRENSIAKGPKVFRG